MRLTSLTWCLTVCCGIVWTVQPDYQTNGNCSDYGVVSSSATRKRDEARASSAASYSDESEIKIPIQLMWLAYAFYVDIFLALMLLVSVGGLLHLNNQIRGLRHQLLTMQLRIGSQSA